VETAVAEPISYFCDFEAGKHQPAQGLTMNTSVLNFMLQNVILTYTKSELIFFYCKATFTSPANNAHQNSKSRRMCKELGTSPQSPVSCIAD